MDTWHTFRFIQKWAIARSLIQHSSQALLGVAVLWPTLGIAGRSPKTKIKTEKWKDHRSKGVYALHAQEPKFNPWHYMVPRTLLGIALQGPGSIDTQMCLNMTIRPSIAAPLHTSEAQQYHHFTSHLLPLACSYPWCIHSLAVVRAFPRTYLQCSQHSQTQMSHCHSPKHTADPGSILCATTYGIEPGVSPENSWV